MYQLQTIKSINPFSRINSNYHFCPTYSQSRLMAAVSNALNNGLSYTSEFNEFVRNELSDILTPELIDAGRDRNENGVLGMDVYYCRQALELFYARQSAKDSLNRLIARGQLHLGKKIKQIMFGLHRFSSAVVIGLDDSEGVAILECKKRGSANRWNVRMPCDSSTFISSL